VQLPHVDGRVVDTTPSLGAVGVGAIDDPERELAVWGTERVFRFPEIPPGLTAAHGR
jgi:hypothetical protein